MRLRFAGGPDVAFFIEDHLVEEPARSGVAARKPRYITNTASGPARSPPGEFQLDAYVMANPETGLPFAGPAAFAIFLPTWQGFGARFSGEVPLEKEREGAP